MRENKTPEPPDYPGIDYPRLDNEGFYNITHALFYVGDCIKYAAELLAKTIREK